MKLNKQSRKLSSIVHGQLGCYCSISKLKRLFHISNLAFKECNRMKLAPVLQSHALPFFFFHPEPPSQRICLIADHKPFYPVGLDPRTEYGWRAETPGRQQVSSLTELPRFASQRTGGECKDMAVARISLEEEWRIRQYHGDSSIPPGPSAKVIQIGPRVRTQSFRMARGSIRVNPEDISWIGTSGLESSLSLMFFCL